MVPPFWVTAKGGFIMGYKYPGKREWGSSPSGEKIYFITYCQCNSKVLLCESEARLLVNELHWLLEDYSVKGFLTKKFRLPKIKIVVDRG